MFIPASLFTVKAPTADSVLYAAIPHEEQTFPAATTLQ